MAVEPNPVALLQAILAASGGAPPPPAGGYPTPKTRYPILWFWKEGTVEDFGSDGTGAFVTAIESVAEHAFTADKNILMSTKADSPANNDKVGIYKWVPCPRSGIVRLRVSFAFPYSNTARYHEFWLSYYDGARRYDARFRCATSAPIAPIVQYYNNAGTWTQVGTWRWDRLENHWNRIDVCVNFATAKQVYFSINNEESDLSLDDLYSAVNAADPALEVRVQLHQVSSAQHHMYVDHILLTEELYEGA